MTNHHQSQNGNRLTWPMTISLSLMRSRTVQIPVTNYDSVTWSDPIRNKSHRTILLLLCVSPHIIRPCSPKRISFVNIINVYYRTDVKSRKQKKNPFRFRFWLRVFNFFPLPNFHLNFGYRFSFFRLYFPILNKRLSFFFFNCYYRFKISRSIPVLKFRYWLPNIGQKYVDDGDKKKTKQKWFCHSDRSVYYHYFSVYTLKFGL